MKRRGVLLGTAAVIVAGGAAWRFRLFAKHYPPTPYDDLLNQITDREPAKILGQAALKSMPGMTPARLAAELRRDRSSLSTRAMAEAGEARLREVAGWVVPESVALFSALAAQA